MLVEEAWYSEMEKEYFYRELETWDSHDKGNCLKTYSHERTIWICILLSLKHCAHIIFRICNHKWLPTDISAVRAGCVWLNI